MYKIADTKKSNDPGRSHRGKQVTAPLSSVSRVERNVRAPVIVKPIYDPQTAHVISLQKRACHACKKMVNYRSHVGGRHFFCQQCSNKASEDWEDY